MQPSYRLVNLAVCFCTFFNVPVRFEDGSHMMENIQEWIARKKYMLFSESVRVCKVKTLQLSIQQHILLLCMSNGIILENEIELTKTNIKHFHS